MVRGPSDTWKLTPQISRRPHSARSITTFNGFVQPFAFNDGYPHTAIHHFTLSQSVLDSINILGSLTITINRNGSGDFYGFDYLSLNDFANPETAVPEPVSLLLLGTGLAGVARWRKRQ